MSDAGEWGRPALVGDYSNFGEALLAAGEQFGEREAFVSGNERLSYAQWARRAQGLAALLLERGIRPGDPVAIVLPSSTDYAICAAAILLVGGVASGINTRLGPREIQAIFAKSSPRLVICEDTFVQPGTDTPLPQLRRGELAAACQRDIADLKLPAVAPDAPACIVWTSGTTGLPKGAWFDHRNLKSAVSTAGVMAAAYDRCLIPLPFAHAGYMAKQWQQVAFAVTYVLTPPVWSAAEMLRLMVEERITAAFGVPTQWAKLIELPEWERADLSALRFCGASTAPVPPELIEAVTRVTGCAMIVRYAMTESPSISGTRSDDPPEVLFRTVGRPQEGVELQVVDAEGKPLPQGSVGRIRLRGGAVMRGYWNDPEATARAITPDGWLIADDMGRVDDNGNLILLGRVSDIYIRGGYKIYPLEVEKVLEEHPDVAQAAIVGKGAPVIGEIGVAFVVPANPAAPPDKDALRQWCRARLADYKTPDQIEFVSELPLTPMLKVNKNALRTRLN
ncbi:MAG: AMP-binding protein [Rhodocyclaceae bacterium]|nr:AMP-binding protein [Rhodocyclaceae bacterium]